MGLQQYLEGTSQLLHDQNFLFVSQAQLTNYINEARRQCAMRTQCIRRLVSGQSAFGASAQPGYFVPSGAQPGALPGAVSATSPLFVQGAAANSLQTIPGQERYPYIGFFNPYLKATHAGCESIIDTIACAVNWGGSVRPTLAWMPWIDLQAYARAYATLVTSFPYYWSVYNDGPQGEIWMFPAPSTTGDIELDCFVLPSDLYDNEAFDAIPEGFRESIKYGAASIAYAVSQRYAQAQIMEQMFAQRMGVPAIARDGGKTPNQYWSSI